MAGLLAARVLGEYFSEVTIIERDLLKDDTMTAEQREMITQMGMKPE
jgi:uncharacterized protein YneF (UPF0154 family)